MVENYWKTMFVSLQYHSMHISYDGCIFNDDDDNQFSLFFCFHFTFVQRSLDFQKLCEFFDLNTRKREVELKEGKNTQRAIIGHCGTAA